MRTSTLDLWGEKKMLNYIRADLHRILRRVPRIVILVLMYLITLAVVMNDAVSKNMNSIGFMADISSVFSITCVFLGMVEIMAVFADDFRAKTMQIAIGIGISRPKVVLAKLIDYAVLSVMDSLVLMILFALGGTACGIQLQGDQIYLMVVCALGNALYMTIAAAITMIPIFYLQSTSLAILFILIVTIDPIKALIIPFGTKDIVINLHLLELPYSTVANTLTTQLSLRNAVPIPQLIGVIAYLAIAYGLTVLAFRKRELDF